MESERMRRVEKGDRRKTCERDVAALSRSQKKLERAKAITGRLSKATQGSSEEGEGVGTWSEDNHGKALHRLGVVGKGGLGLKVDVTA
jgi:hypothetical protein